ncbi:NAD(P)H-binding protein, partial [Thermodesulfobacteriota bacterium]
EEFIRTCGVDYTIIRPGGYTEKEVPDEIAFGEGGKLTGLIKREQIARVCVDALEKPAMKNRTLEVINAAIIKEERRQHVITL